MGCCDHDDFSDDDRDRETCDCGDMMNLFRASFADIKKHCLGSEQCLENIYTARRVMRCWTFDRSQVQSKEERIST